MAIFDIFKKKKIEEKPQKIEEKEKSLEQKLPVQKREIPRSSAGMAAKSLAIPKQKKSNGVIYGIVREPHISEKATNLGEVNQYVFKVFPRANKNEIKKAIEAIYGVDVLAVNIITIPAKKRRLGKTTGFKKGHKKAIVKIRAGQKIEIL